jgi:hypothetical protein
MPKRKVIPPVVILPLSQEMFDKLQHAGTIYGGHLSDKELKKPLMIRWPNPWEKRPVTVNIHNYLGFPHFFCSVREERNYFVGWSTAWPEKKKSLRWVRPWENMDKDPIYAQIVHSMYDGDGNLYTNVHGRDFESGETNSPEAAEAWVDEIIKKHFVDQSKYEFRWDVDPCTKYYKEGD